MSKIYDNLYLGDLKTSQNPVFFERNNIQNVLIAASGLKRPFHKTKKYFQINIADREDELILKEWSSCVEFIHESQGNTLVHCLGGISRSVSTVMAYTMFKENLSQQQSIKKVTKLHSTSNPNPSFLKQLEFWEEILTYYREIQPLNSNEKENFSLLNDLVTKFLDTQQKRISYHIKMISQSKSNKRDKKTMIQESIESDPVQTLIKGIAKIQNKNMYLKSQEEFEQQFCQDKQEDEKDEDYYHIYKEVQEQENDYEICYKEQSDEFQQSNLEQLNEQQIKTKNQESSQPSNSQENIKQNESDNYEWFAQNVKVINKNKNKKKQMNIY